MLLVRCPPAALPVCFRHQSRLAVPVCPVHLAILHDTHSLTPSIPLPASPATVEMPLFTSIKQ